MAMCAGADTLLGPEMRSTGEVMGIDKTFAKAYAKAAIAAGQKLPTSGNVFLTVMDKDKDAVVPIAKKLKVRSGACPGALASVQSRDRSSLSPGCRLTDFSLLDNSRSLT